MLSSREIENQCEKLLIDGVDIDKISVRLVRESLGRGSLATITHVVSDWKKKKRVSNESLEAQLDELRVEVDILKKMLKKQQKEIQELKKDGETQKKGEEHAITPERLLAEIVATEHEVQSGNYLPIFHVRRRFPSVKRAVFDAVLWELAESRKVRLSALQEAWAYSPDQISEGIKQRTGGPLFFIVVE